MSAIRPALIVPVRDDPVGLARLMAQVVRWDLFDEVVVVDDGSNPPVTLPPLPCPARLIRHETPRGGGIARNRGLAEAGAEHVLFFDADDLLTEELGDLLADLGEWRASWDVCIFKHADSRLQAEELWGQSRFDEAFWVRAGVAVGALQVVAPTALPTLAQTANYPWNKIMRRDFLRAYGIGCAPTNVHQDIPLHWLALMRAQAVLASDRIAAWHEVRPAGGRITNARGAMRLEVFEAMRPVARAIEEDIPWRGSFARFALGLGHWIRDGRIDVASWRPFEAAEADFVAREMAGWAESLETCMPDLAAELARREAAA